MITLYFMCNRAAKRLLGFKTSDYLALVLCKGNVWGSVLPQTSDDIMKQTAKVFNGLGKVKEYWVKLYRDHCVKPVHRLSLGQKDKVRS